MLIWFVLLKRHHPQTYVSQPRSSRVPAHGYGEGRGHYYAPRGSI